MESCTNRRHWRAGPLTLTRDPLTPDPPWPLIPSDPGPILTPDPLTPDPPHPECPPDPGPLPWPLMVVHSHMMVPRDGVGVQPLRWVSPFLLFQWRWWLRFSSAGRRSTRRGWWWSTSRNPSGLPPSGRRSPSSTTSRVSSTTSPPSSTRSSTTSCRSSSDRPSRTPSSNRASGGNTEGKGRYRRTSSTLNRWVTPTPVLCSRRTLPTGTVPYLPSGVGI